MTTIVKVVIDLFSFGIILAISLNFLEIVPALLISFGAALLLALLLVLIPIGFRKFVRATALWVIRNAVNDYQTEVSANGIDDREGNIVVGLGIGTNNGVALGDVIKVLNIATRERWGLLEVIEIRPNSCACQVSDRINVEFWEGLELRMRRDASPPTGVAFLREAPEELLEFVERLIRNWGG